MKRRDGNNNSNFRHGSCIGGIEPIYAIWQSMKTRCLCKSNKRYKDYGGRGIIICQEWLIFQEFRKWSMENGYKKGLSLDRIDNNGNYCPENCRWTDYMTQANNKRTNKIIEYKGIKLTEAQWAEKLGIKLGTLSSRINKLHWPLDMALSTEKNTKLKQRKERGE